MTVYVTKNDDLPAYLAVKLRTVLAVTCEWRFCRYVDWSRRRWRCLTTADSLPAELCSYSHLMYAGTWPPPLVAWRRGRVLIPKICTRLRLNARRNWRVRVARDDDSSRTCCREFLTASASLCRPITFAADTDIPLTSTVIARDTSNTK